ncbi:heme exporter protein A [Pseudochelatococcus contaminans]|uniref:Heme exporter protein A n=1 Tax=Pseudochelatococcus contaminans TaxID=1538103 RepID=A0A7W6EFN2_9HYPH|nr:heme exporter protein A [Pseudochelatococcus contaminans]
MFSGIDFTVLAGRALVVTGANGAGKSSLLALLRGSLKPAAGRVVLDGAGERTVAEASHFIGHENALKGMLTASENLAFARDVLTGGVCGKAGMSTDEGLAKLGVAHLSRLPVAYLSAGQKRRVELARLFVAVRPIWLLDEPTAGLDAASVGLFRQLMRDHLAIGGLIIAATHQPFGLAGEQILRIEDCAATADDPEAW